jgi:phenylpropionate dioxygenase-like ring-hydroxylating dioxygenase large terminal subunit
MQAVSFAQRSDAQSSDAASCSEQGHLKLPNGWFSLGSSRDVSAGTVRTYRFMDQEIVVFRTQSGRLGALSAHCPHLGAHMGRGGVVLGEALRCPFHGFRFDASGSCVATGYGTKPPPQVRTRSFAVDEKHGLLLVHHYALGRPPAWQVPEIDTAGWSAFLFSTMKLRGHPQETTENSVDLGHFSWVHGYEDIAVVDPPSVAGATWMLATHSPAPSCDGVGAASA